MEDGGGGHGNIKLFCVFAEVLGTVDHSLEHGSYALPGGIELAVLRGGNVMTILRVVEPRLSFQGPAKSLVDFMGEGSDISPPRPCFRNHGIHCAGGASNLIDQ